MTQYFVYVLLLQNNKWLLHVSDNISTTSLHIECRLLYDFAKTNLPISTYEQFAVIDALQIDYYVKQYMYCYGVDNVRGGSYADEFLSSHQILLLNRELSLSFRDYKQNNNIVSAVLSKYHMIDVWTDNDVTRELAELNAELTKYQRIKQLVQDSKYIGVGDNKIVIDRRMIDDVEWINGLLTIDHIDITKSDRLRYANIMQKLKAIIPVYLKLIDNCVELDIYDTCPGFAFDLFCYHRKNKTEMSQRLTEAKHILFRFENILYRIINRHDEWAFALSTYSPTFYKESKYAIEYISMNRA